MANTAQKTDALQTPVWDERIGGAIARLRHAMRSMSSGAVILLEIERFSHLRAQIGYARSYALVGALERRLREVSRPGDAVHSLGDSRILVIASGASSLSRATAVSRNLLRCLEQLVAESAELPPVRASVGLSVFPADGTRPLELLRKAETAAVTAREEERGPIAIFEPTMGAESWQEGALAWGLARAIQQGGIEVRYQPQVDAASGELVALEALARWTVPERGPISPGRFVPLAEENGLIDGLTEAVLRQVCEDVPRWQALGGPELRVSINLSAVELAGAGRGERLLSLLEECGVSAERLEFELTESAIVRCLPEVQRSLDALRRAGALIAIDDFGTGYASLAYLADFSADILKIDRRFVAGLSRDARAVELVRAIASLGRSFGMTLVGEGAESREEVSALRALGVDRIQGCFYSRPVPLEDCRRRFEVISGEAPGADAPAMPSALDLPTLPAVMTELLAMRRSSPRLDSRVQALCEADPTLAVHLLVNASRDVPRERYDLGEALVAFGAWPLVSALRRSMSHKVFLPTEDVSRHLWLHSVQTACWAAAIAPHVEDGPPEPRAYLAGLLHDLGRFLVLQYRPEVVASQERQRYRTPEQLRESERALNSVDHAAYGAAAAEAWGLDEELCVTLAWHHSAQLPAEVAEHRRMVQVVRLADMLSLLMQTCDAMQGASPRQRAERIREEAGWQRVATICPLEILAGLWTSVESRSCSIIGRLALPM